MRTVSRLCCLITFLIRAESIRAQAGGAIEPGAVISTTTGPFTAPTPVYPGTRPLPPPSYPGPAPQVPYQPSQSAGYSPAGRPAPESGYGLAPIGQTYSSSGSGYTAGGQAPSYSGSGSVPSGYVSSGGSYVLSGGNTYSGAGSYSGGYPNAGGSYGPAGPAGGCCGGAGGGYGFGHANGGCGLCGDNSDPCYRKYSDFIIVNAQPYERRSQISLDACKGYCRNSASGQYQCRSFVFDNNNQICDLFAHTGNQAPAKLVKYPGRDYYEPTGLTNCTSGTTSTPAPSGAPCTSGQTARYIQVPGYAYSGGVTGTQTPGTSIQSCIDACNRGQASGGQSITCKSFDFINGQCTLYSSSPPPAGQGAGLTANANSVHVDQICANAGQSCVGPAERDPQMILVGFAEMVTDAKDFNDCYQKCINAKTTSNVDCKSALFYYQESSNNCIINTETKTAHPDLFNKETQDVVDYFEPNCAGGALSSASSAATGRRLSLLRGFVNKKPAAAASADDANALGTDDESLSSTGVLGEWTHWSPCDRRKDGRRIRYRVCTNKPLKQCPFESEWCNLSAEGSSRRTSQSSSPLFGLTAFTLRNITETSDHSADINCPVDVCCPIFGGCRIGLQRASATGQVHWCTNPCRASPKKK